MSDLDARLKNLTPQQRALLEAKVARARRAPQGPVPLAPVQRRFWLLEQLAPGSAQSNEANLVHLEGALDAAALERAFQALVDRHEVLRTSFGLEHREPVQRVAPSAAVALERVDLRGRGDELISQALERAQRPFDLSNAPLLRATLYSLGPDRHALGLTAHHLVSDGGSWRALLTDLAALYAGVALPPLPTQYATWAGQQRAALTASRESALAASWRTELEGAPQLLQLPTDHPRSASPLGAGGRVTLPLSEELVRSLQTLAQRQGSTLYMTLASAFAVLLGRLARQEELLLGTPFSLRSGPELEPLVGCFINTLALRCELGGNPTFRELLSRVKARATAAYANGELPFDALVHHLGADRSAGQAPLVQAFFDVQATPDQLALPGLTLWTEELPSAAAKAELGLSVFLGKDGARAVFEHSLDLFTPQTVRRWAGAWLNLLEGVVANPEAPIGSLPLQTRAERGQLLAWEGETNLGAIPCVLERFHAYAATQPDAPAVRDDQGELSYSQLSVRARQLAAALRQLGVAPGARVAVSLRPSVDLIATLLGVFEAGAVFVPVDAHAPRERREAMLSDAQVTAVVRHPGLEEATEHLPAIELRGADALPAPADHRRSEPGELAYLIFTSGSTGRPKAVAVPHASLAQSMEGCIRALDLGPSDVTLSLASCAFDAFMGEVWQALASGGLLVVRGREQFLDTPRLLEVLRTTTSAHVMPALLGPVVDAVLAQGDGAGYALRTLCTGGDVVPSALLNRAKQAFPRSRVCVLYGPTESTIVCMGHEVLGEEGERHLIGKPWPGFQARVVEPSLEAAPLGLPGELLIGGPCVSRGYANDPELTAARFIERDGQRWYRTGDLARWLPNGELEFLGRIDSQVKIRGFRVELGEVEAALAQQPGVKDALALAERDARGAARLLAWVTTRGEPGPDFEARVREALARSLPSYMVPSALFVLDRLPATLNGKIDRRALPRPQAAAKPAEPPQGPLEQVLLGMWETALERKGLSRDDVFFEVGGHSLLAARLVAEARELFRVDLPLRSLLEAPTVAGWALALEARAPSKTQLAAIARAYLRVAQMTEDEVRSSLELRRTSQG